jgi:hypothetical protein
MNRRSMLIPVAVLAATVAANPASAAEGNGWQCISPFANFTNSTYPDDPPAPGSVLDTLAINVTREDSAPLTAIPGQSLPLRDLKLRLKFTDTRVVEQMYRRTGGASYSYRGIPWQQVADTSRTFSIRQNPADANADYWSYNAGTSATPNWIYAEKITVANQAPKIRDANTTENTTFVYAAPTLAFAHRYLSHTGNSQFPLDAWVAISASNTAEGSQVLPVKGYWTVNIKDATPGSATAPADYANDEVIATIEDVALDLPRTNWTPTGAGPVTFQIAPAGNLGVVQIESKGYDRVGYNTPLNVKPFGSVFVRAQTESYGASNDCVPGSITVANTSIPASFWGDSDSAALDPAVGQVGTPGMLGTTVVKGAKGRYAFGTENLPAPLAIAALPPVAVPIVSPAPAPAAPAAVKLDGKSTLTPSRTGALELDVTNPNAVATKYKLAVKTVSKYKVGKTRKVVSVASTKTVTLAPGASDVGFKLTKAAKTLLKQHKSVKVKVTLTPVAGGKAVTKTITLKSTTKK